jgi:thioredoxin-related protein
MNKMKNKAVPLLVLMFLCSLGSSYAQAADALTFPQLDSLQKVEQKPVLVFIHTSWCKYCEAMEHGTFQNQEIKELLEKKFYFVELNAEEKQDISVQGHTFRYRPTGTGAGLHELAQELGMIDGKISYPTLCFLNPDYEIIYQNPGFLTAKQLIKMLRALGSRM